MNYFRVKFRRIISLNFPKFPKRLLRQIRWIPSVSMFTVARTSLPHRPATVADYLVCAPYSLPHNSAPTFLLANSLNLTLRDFLCLGILFLPLFVPRGNSAPIARGAVLSWKEWRALGGGCQTNRSSLSLLFTCLTLWLLMFHLKRKKKKNKKKQKKNILFSLLPTKP